MTRRPRVLVLTTSYPSPADPVAGVFVREHARAVEPYADVRVVHLDRGGAPRRRPVRIDDDDIPGWRIGFTALAPLWGPGIVEAGAAGLRAAAADDWRPDLLHAHFFLAGLPAVLIGRARRLPVVVTEHWTVFTPEDPSDLARPLAAVARFTLRRADAVLPVSAELAQSLETFGVRRPMLVVPNAVDGELFHPPAGRVASSRRRRLIFVGLLGPQKGVDVLLRAFSVTQSDTHLDVVGDGPLRGEHEKLACELGVADRVVFHGVRSKAEIAEMMRTAHLFVSGSRFENNPVAIIEALASGLPVAATAVGAVAEMVGGDGLVVPAEDPPALAMAIDRALSQSYDAEAIARRALDRYGFAAVGRALASVYGTLAPE